MLFDDGAGGWGNSDLWNCKFNGISIAFDIRVNSTVDYCWVNACTSGASAVVSDNSDTFKNCVFTANTTLTFSAKAVKRSTFYNNGSNSSGMVTTVKTIDECLFHTTTGASNIIAQNCVAIENSIFVNNAAATSSCISGLASDNTAKVVNCGFYNNTQDVVTGSTYSGYRVVSKIVLTGDPCTSASGGDFSLNNTAGAGALLRGTGFPTTFANGLTANALDVGPAQHVASAAGATAFAF